MRSLLVIILTALALGFCARNDGGDKTTPADSLQSVAAAEQPPDPLPSWNQTPLKQKILRYIRRVTEATDTAFIPPEDRIAVFDTDGTLWPEQPTYWQIQFVLHRIKQLAPKHPDWEEEELIQAALRYDLKRLREDFGLEGLGRLMSLAQAGLTVDEFRRLVLDWMKTARHPFTGMKLSDMVYRPMKELIGLLRENNFKVFLVSSGGVDFVRVWAEQKLDIPRQNIIGSLTRLDYKNRKGIPVLITSNEIIFVADGEGKPKAIHQMIGRKPVVAFGNSDGDVAMLEWCAANTHLTLPVLVRHTDGRREWAYDKRARVGRLDKGLTAAAQNGWLVVDMKKDWKVIYLGENNHDRTDRNE